MKRVLITEDEKFIRMGLKTMVERSGIPVEEILEARDGEEALEILKEKSIDLLITDIRMPKMDGIELVEQLKTLSEKPMVLVVSGYEDFNYAIAMLRNGVSDYLLKPVERQKLCEVLEKLEGRYQENRQQASDEVSQYLHGIRFIMLEREAESKEAEELIKRYSESFFQGGYYAFCISGSQEKVPEKATALRAENHCMIYLVPEEEKESFVTEAAQVCGVSRLHHGLWELREAYQESVECWKFSFFRNGGVCEEAPEAEEKQAPVDVEQLLGMLSFSRDKEIIKLLEAQADSVAAGKLLPEGFEKLCGKFIQELCNTYKSMFGPAEDPVRFARVWDFESRQQYMKQMAEWLSGFCERITQEFADHEKKQQIREAVQYVNENYCKSLNMATVSNQVSMNYSLFSILFKEYTGTNFITYLQNLRIEEAKRLLSSTDWRVAEIGRKVGFGDEKHFLKLFKSVTGFSPTEYRKSQQLKESMDGEKY